MAVITVLCVPLLWLQTHKSLRNEEQACPWSHRLFVGRGPAYRRWYLPKISRLWQPAHGRNSKMYIKIGQFSAVVGRLYTSGGPARHPPTTGPPLAHLQHWKKCNLVVGWLPAGPPPVHHQPTTGLPPYKKIKIKK